MSLSMFLCVLRDQEEIYLDGGRVKKGEKETGQAHNSTYMHFMYTRTMPMSRERFP